MMVLSTHCSDLRGTNALKRALADIDAPGWCVAYGDRCDMAKAVLDARYAGKKIAHVAGGETPPYIGNGHPDHRTRDAISVMSDLHFVANNEALENLKELGIYSNFNYGCIYVTGCPSLDEIVAYAKTLDPNRKRKGIINWFPEDQDGAVWRPFARQQRKTEWEFMYDIAHCELFRTNSSAGLREAPILGTPVEMVGSRQAGRAAAGTFHAPNGDACEQIRKIILEVCK